MRLPELAPTPSTSVSGKTNGRCGLVLSPRPLPTQGHLQVAITNDNGKRIMEYVHRLVALAFLEKIEYLSYNLPTALLQKRQTRPKKRNLKLN